MRPSAALAAALGAVALLGSAAPAPAASGATLRTDFSCYLQARRVLIEGTGFAAGATYSVTVDGRALGQGTVAADGSIAGSVDSGRLPAAEGQALHRVTVSDGRGQTLTTTFATTSFSAGFTPTTGDPRTLLVRFSAYGFAPGSPTRRPLYLHYLSPLGHGVRTIAIGSTHVPCGTISVTRERHLFPFRARAGTWHIQFDTSARYSPTTRPRVVHAVRVS